MNNVAITYKSQYGTTKQYAEWIAEALDAPIFEVSEIKPAQLMSYDMVIHGGGLYAGGIDGIKLVTKNPCKALTVFTVGLADPSDTDYSDILNKNFKPDQLAKVKVFHLRGGMDYKKLGIIHRGMMAMLKRMTAKKPESELAVDDKILLDTYGKKLDFMDKDSIKPLVEFVKGQFS